MSSIFITFRLSSYCLILFCIACNPLLSIHHSSPNSQKKSEREFSQTGETVSFQKEYEHGIWPSASTDFKQPIYWNIAVAPLVLLKNKPHIYVFFHGDNERSLPYRIKYFQIPDKVSAARKAGVNAIFLMPSSNQKAHYDARWQSMTQQAFDQMVALAVVASNQLQGRHDLPKEVACHLISFSGGYRPLPQIIGSSDSHVASLVMLDSIYRYYDYIMKFAWQQSGNIIIVSTGGEPLTNALRVEQGLRGYSQFIHIQQRQAHHYENAKAYLAPTMVYAKMMSDRQAMAK